MILKDKAMKLKLINSKEDNAKVHLDVLTFDEALLLSTIHISSHNDCTIYTAQYLHMLLYIFESAPLFLFVSHI